MVLLLARRRRIGFIVCRFNPLHTSVSVVISNCMCGEIDFDFALIDCHLVSIPEYGRDLFQRHPVGVWEPDPHRNSPESAGNDEAEVKLPLDFSESCGSTGTFVSISFQGGNRDECTFAAR